MEKKDVQNPFFAWFPKANTNSKKIITIIKEAMLVLLILFPIVMLEFKFLSPLTSGLNLSLATFIGNVISVSLISFPMMPICIYFLGWWLRADITLIRNISGFLLVLLLYLVEIWIFL